MFWAAQINYYTWAVFGILDFVLHKLFYLPANLSLQFTFYLYFPLDVFYGCNIPPQLWMFCPLYSWGSNFDLGTKCNKKKLKKKAKGSVWNKSYTIWLFLLMKALYLFYQARYLWRTWAISLLLATEKIRTTALNVEWHVSQNRLWHFFFHQNSVLNALNTLPVQVFRWPKK